MNIYETCIRTADERLYIRKDSLVTSYLQVNIVFRTSEQFTQEVVCPLCNVLCRHPRAVSMHLRSASHRDLENQLYGN